MKPTISQWLISAVTMVIGAIAMKYYYEVSSMYEDYKECKSHYRAMAEIKELRRSIK